MKNYHRVIPTLLLQDRDFVKTIKFSNPRYLGDPINIMRIFNDKFVDELCILNITNNLKKNNFDFLKDIFSECLLPLSYGGNIGSIEDVRKIFKIGADKIIFSSNLYQKPELVKETIKEVGSQGVVGCVNVIENANNYSIYLSGTKELIHTNNIQDKIKELVDFGLGELIINFVSRDGMKSGYDYNFIKKISTKIGIPLIVLGGANSKDDFNKAINSGANAVAASSYFVFMGNRDAVMLSYNK